MAMKSATVRHPRIVAIALLCGVTPVLAQQASIAGLVTDSASRHPLVSAQVLVGGTTLRTLTDRAGRFRFDAVPAGGVTLRVLRIGYKPSSRTISVTAGEGATADFALQSAPIGLDAVVVTATGEQTQREQSNAIHRFDAGDITSKAPVLDMSNLLSARAPGLIVQVAGGPTASALYGTDAANGVIQIRTKQGKPGPTRWDVYAEGGVLNNVPTYPANYRGADAIDSTCTLISQLAGKCTQTRLHVFNPIETFSPFRTGHRQEYGRS